MNCFSAGLRGGDENISIVIVSNHKITKGDMSSIMHIPTEDTNNKDTTGYSMLRKTDAMNDSGLEDV
jgi:hypothetical protein